MPKIFNIYSSLVLEPWNHLTPMTTGIGGSEVCHIEYCQRLEKWGHVVNSFAPIAKDDPTNLPNWRHFEGADKKAPGTWLVFRDPKFFDDELNSDNNYVFVAQDVDYQWTPERLEKVSKYICLCPEHVNYTMQKYPQLEGRILLSSNGIRTELIEEVENLAIPRNLNKIIYPSSPDRGLEFLLQNWFRVLERVPSAELHIFYGFNNVEELGRKFGGWYVEYPERLKALMNQKGVNFRGRINQKELIKEWFSANIWWYPTDWPETSCITSMEAQACGALPVVTNLWALRDNILHGYKSSRVPQDDFTSRLWQIDKVCENLGEEIPERQIMMSDARKRFDWENFINQIEEL